MPRRPRDLATTRAMRDRFAADIDSGLLTTGQAIKRMRELSGLTQAAFAKRMGVGLLTLKNVENDKGNPTVETLDRIGRIFGLRVGYVTRRPPIDAGAADPGPARAGGR
jgi:Predicted transcriptional regulators